MALTLLSPGRTSAWDRDDSDSAAGIQQGFLWRKRATPPSQLKADPRWEASREPCPQGEAVPQTVGLGLRKQHLHLEYTEQNGSLRGLDENVIVWIPKSLQYELETTTKKKKRCWFYFVIIKKMLVLSYTERSSGMLLRWEVMCFRTVLEGIRRAC